MTLAALCSAGLPPAIFGHADPEERVAELTAQIGRDPTNPELILRRADAHRRHKDFDLALADLASASQLKPSWPTITLLRAQTLEDAGRFREAIEAADKFLTTWPGHGGALLLRARCLVKSGLRREALADYDAALAALAEPSPDLFMDRARLQASLGQLEAAVHGLDEAEGRLGQVPALQLASIAYERQRGNFEGAVARAERAATRSPAKDSWLIIKGEVLEQAGRLTEAQATLSEALSGLEGSSGSRRSAPAVQQLERQAREGLARVQAKQAARRQLTRADK